MFIRDRIQPPPPPTPAAAPSPVPSRRRFVAGWGDMDFNGHMRNTAYLDKAADARLAFFADCGFPISEFQRLGFGPVVQRDAITYFREVRLLESVDVTVELAGLSADGSRFLIRNTFHRHDGVALARVDSAGGWLDLAARRLVAPPGGLLEAMRRLPRCKDFQPLDALTAKAA